MNVAGIEGYRCSSVKCRVGVVDGASPTLLGSRVHLYANAVTSYSTIVKTEFYSNKMEFHFNMVVLFLVRGFILHLSPVM